VFELFDFAEGARLITVCVWSLGLEELCVHSQSSSIPLLHNMNLEYDAVHIFIKESDVSEERAASISREQDKQQVSIILPDYEG
jgi:uncharacterized protein YueI